MHSLFLTLAASALVAPTGAASAPSDTVLVRAGTIHTVDMAGTVLTDAEMLVVDGRIVAIGSDLTVPTGAHVVDYGPDAVLAPGFVAASSDLAQGAPPARTAAPDLSAVDGFDFYARYVDGLAAGITSVYITPARNRLIAGRGAVVTLGEGEPETRVLNDAATIHGAISAEARNTPGYWEPPIPATVDVGLGQPEQQLPRTTMGAVLALRELLDGVAAGAELEAYGPTTIANLSELIESGAVWRMTAVSETEIRALLNVAAERGLRLVIDGAHYAGDLAEEIALSGASVIYEVPFRGNRAGVNRGKSDDARWPELDVPARLVAAGVPLAISPAAGSPLRDIRFAASIARKGGLDSVDALAGLTRVPAMIYGVADQVGSLEPGKRADFAVYTGDPLAAGSTVRATWVGGALAWKPKAGTAAASTATVVSVEELHLGDGQVIAPGEVLLRGGKIVEVGRRVARPSGATVVRGTAAMPGMVDARGRLGLDGSRRMPATDFDLTQIVEPGDSVDRRVARAGVTTVVLDFQGSSGSGAPLLAYRPAAEDFDDLVVDPLAALRLSWSDSNRLKSGDGVRNLLGKAVAYRQKWIDYERELAEYEPEEAAPEFRLPEIAEDEEGDDEEEEEDEDEDKKKKKKRKDKELDPDPTTGIWLGGLTVAGSEEGAEPVRLRMQIRLEGEDVSGFLRCAALSSRLIEVTGTYATASEEEEPDPDEMEGTLTLSGEGDAGEFTLTATFSDILEEPEEDITLEGTVDYGGAEHTVAVTRQSREYPVAKRPAPKTSSTETAEAPKGAPKEPRVDTKLEPLRRAMDGKVAVMIAVDRADEIVACVDACAEAGIRPVLIGASDALKVADKVASRVSGLLVSTTISSSSVSEENGYAVSNRLADLQAAGYRVAFYSNAEEGAADLPMMAAYAVASGMSPTGALKALTSDAAAIMAIDDTVGHLAVGRSADVLLLDGPPLDPATSVQRVWVAGEEVR